MRLLLITAVLLIFLTGWSMALANPQKFMDGRINQTVQFPLCHNISKPDQVFNLEWRFIQEEISSSILTFSPNSLHPFISETFKNRVNFSRTNAVLLLKDIQTTDEGTYELEVTNAAGKSSKRSVFLTVNVAVSTPQVEMIPEAPQIGENVTLQCSAQKGNRIQYSWYRCDLPLSSEMNYHLTKNNKSLTIQNVQKSDVGIYRCKVENRISSNHVDFVMQLCLPLSENPVIYGHLGYGGYLGYIGYIILIVLCCQRKIQAKKLSTESETIYENSHISKQMALSSMHDTKILCNIPKSKQSMR
ncbi:HEPACAM family member 2-like [Hypanus sabinus]|uniref:HEPACAM family member 2-like n=1 Tax=Hypanus sabinus TaxID=79690 RepID=UPI0028C4309D|nr:HEPACAM family member 2-like [Hypanus sabinus]XP_059827139.1 HEPACAM family member 2-like [Hypanus sabinus]